MKIIKKIFEYLKLVIKSLYLSFSFVINFGLLVFISGVIDEVKLNNGNKTIQEIYEFNFNQMTINELFNKILEIANNTYLLIIILGIIFFTLFLTLQYENKKKLEGNYDKKNI